MAQKFTIVLGSRNLKKAQELDALFGHSSIKLVSLSEFPDAIEVEETGLTFAENAQLKATHQAKKLRQWVLGEDSGLSVEALDGRPGVWSARYAGQSCNDDRNNRKLLSDLSNVPPEKRTAWYTCHMSLSDPQGKIWIDCEDRCYGVIISEYRGDQGFGYDPLFEIPEYHQTFGQLGLAIKSVISHRAKTAREFLRQFKRLESEFNGN